MTTVARVRHIVHGQVLLARLLWACSPALTLVGATAAVARALAAAVLMLASGRLVGGLADGRLDTRWLVLTLTALVLQTVLAAARDRAPRGSRCQAGDRRGRRGVQPAVLPGRAVHLAGGRLPALGPGGA